MSSEMTKHFLPCFDPPLCSMSRTGFKWRVGGVFSEPYDLSTGEVVRNLDGVIKFITAREPGRFSVIGEDVLPRADTWIWAMKKFVTLPSR